MIQPTWIVKWYLWECHENKFSPETVSVWNCYEFPRKISLAKKKKSFSVFSDAPPKIRQIFGLKLEKENIYDIWLRKESFCFTFYEYLLLQFLALSMPLNAFWWKIQKMYILKKKKKKKKKELFMIKFFK